IQLALEETEIPLPDGVDFFFGTSVYRGTYERTGIVDATAPREVNGYYWRYETAGPIEAAPVVFGTSVYVGTTEGTFFALDQTTGNEIWTMPPEGRIGAAPALGEGEMAENQAPMMIVVVDDDGAVRGHDAAVSTGVQWTTRLDSRIRSSPVIVEGRVYLATDEGFVHALDLISGDEIWRFPSDGADLGTISADLAFHNGILYVATEEGFLHLIDVAGDTPSEVCQFDAFDPIVTNPIVTEDVTYVATMGQNIWPLPTGACDGNVPGRLPTYVADTPVRVGPAIVGDTIYMPGGRYLYSIDLTSGEHLWEPSKVTAEAPISTPPVVTADTVYVASEDGVVRAVDAISGETLWQWQTGLHVRAAPAVVDGVVFIAAGDGYVYAVGP
ncbi:MAG TPA: PQQ-binding-like beta-propeller repeat protein, partial [Acidimicrobiia bacterium]